MADDQEPKTEDISDELLRKYDPERLLKIIGKRAGRGESLDHSVRSKYEKKFGVDLGHVRVFTGEFADVVALGCHGAHQIQLRTQKPFAGAMLMVAERQSASFCAMSALAMCARCARLRSF